MIAYKKYQVIFTAFAVIFLITLKNPQYATIFYLNKTKKSVNTRCREVNMKAFYILVLTVVVLIGMSSLVGVQNMLPEGASEAEVYIANQNKMTICCINPEQLGNTLQQEGDVLGFAIRYELGKVSENQLLSSLKAQVVKVERVGDITLYYAYSHRMSNTVKVDGKKVNVQIAVTDSAITVGSPLIMGSY